jgi:hypothetical protein
LLSFGVAAFAAAGQNARTIAEQHCRQFEHAMLTRNLRYFEKRGTLHFVMTEGKTNLNSQEAAANIAQLFRMVKTIKSAHSTVESAKLSGTTLIVVTENTVTAEAISVRHKPMLLVEKNTAREVWIKTADGWKVKSIQTLQDKSTLNGKRFGSVL